MTAIFMVSGSPDAAARRNSFDTATADSYAGFTPCERAEPKITLVGWCAAAARAAGPARRRVDVASVAEAGERFRRLGLRVVAADLRARQLRFPLRLDLAGVDLVLVLRRLLQRARDDLVLLDLLGRHAARAHLRLGVAR